MTFKSRKIRHRPRRRPLVKTKGAVSALFGSLKKLPSKTKNYIAAGILVFFGVFVVVKVTMAAYHFVSDFSPQNLIEAIGSDLKKDDHNYTNVLLLGDGGHERDGADLIDTIMVASIDYEKNSVSLLSIPRDFYVKLNEELGMQFPGKINELYRNHKYQLDEEGRFQLFKRVVGDIVDLDIQYYARVDFNAFVEIIDSLDGITVDVQEDIYDPYYPNETDNGYTVFSVDKGLQEMNGETALKFARSRKTTSDFDRAARQQLVLEAIQQKALSKDVLTSPGRLKELYGTLQDNLNTDMTIREMVSLAGFAKQMDRSRLVRKVIHDDPGQEGGFLVTPDRDLYNKQFVLVPFGTGYELIHKYADLVFNQREMFYEPAVIEVLNATKYPGIARSSAYQLIRFGFDVESIDNYYDENDEKTYLQESTIIYHDYTEKDDGLIQPKHQSTLNALDGFVKGYTRASRHSFPITEDKHEKVYEGGRYDISIVLGDDYDVFLVK
jgi:LCP family protein required for cell wall assembly